MTSPIGRPASRSRGEATLLVLSDSLAYYGPEGGLPADDERIWPNVVGSTLGERVELFGRIGWTTRDLWWALTQDPRIWAAVPRADAVVVAAGGMDTLPSPLPTALREQIRYIRPGWLRQRVRDVYGAVQPRLSLLGWPVALPAPVSVSYLDRICAALRAVRPGLPILLCLPPTHRSPYYGFVHSGRLTHTTAMRRWAGGADVATVDFYPITAAAFASAQSRPTVPTPGRAEPDTGEPGIMNPDGIHWGFDCHRQIAELVVGRLREMGVGPAADPPGAPTLSR